MRTRVFTFGGFVRQDQYNYYPSANPFADLTPDLQSQTIGQNRRLTNAGASRQSFVRKGIHNLKAGVTYQHTFITEKDSFGIVDPTANAPCLKCGRKLRHGPGLTDPAHAPGAAGKSRLSIPLLPAMT